MHFDKLRLIEPLLQAVHSEGYTTPTEIQQQAIPHVLAGKDLLGCAQTGTGKTAAFALPILQRLNASHAVAAPVSHKKPVRHAGRPSGPDRPIRAMILSPTRELAAQIGESFGTYGKHLKLRHTVIFGGVGQGAQVQALRKGVDILVATPGRLLDLLNQRHLRLDQVEVFVLDEADRMLDMGFIHDIRRVIALLPTKRQTLMFSATMPKEIRTLADTILCEPVSVKVEAESAAADTVEQSLYHVEHASKLALLQHLLSNPDITRALVFTRTKHGADKVVKRLSLNEVAAEAIHSNKSQNARLRALANFKNGATRVLVASDIAARGLDVDQISHVINFDLPSEPETYVHRIGRTGRAGAQGQAISFCCDEQREALRDIERLLGRSIPVLRHSIKPTAEAATREEPHRAHSKATHQPRATAPKRAAAHPGHAEAIARKTGSPEQQKSEFWRRKRRPRRRGGAGTRTARRGRE